MQEEIRDPTGFEAILTDECWAHITTRHPEMGPFRESVAETIHQPDGIYLGKRDPKRRIYRKRYRDIPVPGGSFDLLVFVGNADGYVATAYFAALSFRMIGALIWPTR
jgi:hypothetical protein